MEQYDICVICPPEDGGIANTLAESIRRYRLPGGTVLPDPSLGYQRIYVDDSGSAFDPDVQRLLDRCSCLVVICSPRTKHAQGILDRIHYFRDIRKDEDVIAVIVEGEPIDSFPELFIEKKLVRHILPNMKIIEREETIEPVAADLRGDTPARRKQLLRYETVRITASALGLHPDALEQRHRRRRSRTIAAAATVAGLLFLFAAGVFLRLGLIARREGQIAEQQAAISVAASQRMVEELPALFQDDPQAMSYIQASIDSAQQALAEIAAQEADREG